MKRSAHIAVQVPPERLDEAAHYYRSMLGLEETSRNENEIELKGPNFMLYLEPSTKPVVLQEFIAENGTASSEKFVAAGCEVFGESDLGFHVRDPFGMSYHVWTSTERSPE